MKKGTIGVVCALLLAACTNEKNVAPNPAPENPGEQRIELAIEGDFETRALYGEDTRNPFENCIGLLFKKIDAEYVYQSMLYLLVPLYPETTFPIYTFSEENRLEVGDYVVIVFGGETGNKLAYSVFSGSGVVLPETGVSTLDQSMFYTQSLYDDKEFYLGSTSMSVTSERAGFSTTVTMKRALSGILGYFANVPAEIGGEAVATLEVRITHPSGLNNYVTMDGSHTYGAFDIEVENTEYVSPIRTSVPAITLPLTSQTVTDEIYTGNELPEAPAGFVRLPNTQLASTMFMPTDGCSMSVRLLNAGGTVLKEWTVLDEGGEAVFDLKPNYLYTIGVKQSATSTSGAGDTPQPDAPVDLTVAAEDPTLTLTLQNNWSSIVDDTLIP